MSTDRELLELAAKAAGIDLGWENEIPYTGMGSYMPAHWNPLTDDGDALRLAVKLNLNIMPGVARDEEGNISVEKPKGNEYAETRRAIVRAAAEIGRNMP